MSEHTKRIHLCLLKEKEVSSFLQEVKATFPWVEIALFSGPGTLQILLQGEKKLDEVAEKIRAQFKGFCYGDGRIEEAVHREMIGRKKTLVFAESCTGGALSAKLTAIPGASKFFLGSLIAYSNEWKERFLQVSRTTLEKKGSVSKEVVIEMVRGLLQETNADFAAAISGIAGPEGGSSEKPVGTVYIAIGQRGDKIDAGGVHLSGDRSSIIELASNLTLGALWRRLVHQAVTFS